jgi:hypothetical protein
MPIVAFNFRFRFLRQQSQFHGAALPGAPASDRSAGFAKADNAQRPSGADRSPRLNP